MVGSTLSHYRITAELGRGGMGIVYRGEDTSLDRTVAIKVLPGAALATEDDRARFYREAKAAASLTHPNIAVVYEVGEAVPSDAPHGTQPSPFIAMEFIDGETLEARIRQGPLKLEEAVRIASEIGSGLEAAHEKDIVHRDIKSANVMLTSKGVAKILDFGLAKTAQSTKLTRMGSTLGTIAYMSPEQARGEEVDRRTDIWALGTILYEMIAGRNAFPGDYEQAVVYSILNEDPEPLTAIRAGLPMSIDWVVSKCLAKKADARYQSASDLLIDLKNIDSHSRNVSSVSRPGSMATSAAMSAAMSTSMSAGLLQGSSAMSAGSQLGSFEGPIHVNPTTRQLTPRTAILFAVTVVVAGLFGAFLQRANAPGGEQPVRRWDIPVPGLYEVKISPDGRWLAFSIRDTLFVRAIDSSSKMVVDSGSGGRAIAWSWDSQYLAVFHSGKYIRWSAQSREAITLASVPDVSGYSAAFISPDEILLSFGQGSAVGSFTKVSITGDRIVPVEDMDTRGSGAFTQLAYVPGTGRTLGRDLKINGVHNIRFVDQGESLFPADTGGDNGRLSGDGLAFSSSDVLLFGDGESGIWAGPLDVETSTLSAPAKLIVADASVPSVSDEGTLIAIKFRPRRQIMSWYGLDGTFQADLHSPSVLAMRARISGNEGRLIFQENDRYRLWDLNDGQSQRIDILAGDYNISDWLPGDADLLAVNWNDYGFHTIGLSSMEVSEPFIKLDNLSIGARLAAGDSLIVFVERNDRTGTGRDIALLPVKINGPDIEATGPVRQLVNTTAQETHPVPHPSAPLVVYSSDASGTWEIFVRSLSDDSIVVPIYSGFASGAVWNRDGSRLYFVTETDLMVADVDLSSQKLVGAARPLFALPRDYNDTGVFDDIFTLDERNDRILLPRLYDPPNTPVLIVIENWEELLK